MLTPGKAMPPLIHLPSDDDVGVEFPADLGSIFAYHRMTAFRQAIREASQTISAVWHRQ